MYTICLFVLCLGVASAKTTPRYDLGDAPQHFETFLRTYNKTYGEAEKERRYEIFLSNLNKINMLNEQSRNARYDITRFSDLTTEEFLEKHTGYIGGDLGDCSDSDELILPRVHVSDAFDWRDRGVVTEVKDQGSCGSCWAFSTTGNVESAYAIKSGQTILLSEQQLVDCDKGSIGCQGGLPTAAFQYLETNGAMSEDDYPYQGSDGQCQFDSSKVKVQVGGCVIVQGSEDDIAEKLTQIGPLSIALDASQLQHYKGGVVTAGSCQGQEVDHAVLLVGYGKDGDGTSYWIVKNSWGTGWGENGYFRIQRGVNCLSVAQYPPSSAIVKT